MKFNTNIRLRVETVEQKLLVMTKLAQLTGQPIEPATLHDILNAPIESMRYPFIGVALAVAVDGSPRPSSHCDINGHTIYSYSELSRFLTKLTGKDVSYRTASGTGCDDNVLIILSSDHVMVGPVKLTYADIRELASEAAAQKTA